MDRSLQDGLRQLADAADWRHYGDGFARRSACATGELAVAFFGVATLMSVVSWFQMGLASREEAGGWSWRTCPGPAGIPVCLPPPPPRFRRRAGRGAV